MLLLASHAMPGRVAVASVDHGLRPESAAEAAFVADLCAELDVPHAVLSVQVGVGNLQQQARMARYDALAEWLDGEGLAALATGHQLDDQAETLLMRLNRGSGLAGLAAVRSRGVVPRTTIPLLRPLLGWRRAALDQLVRRAGIDPVRDPSNFDPQFDRVRIRQAMQAADWIEPEGLARSAALLGDAETYLSQQIDEAFSAGVRMQGEAVIYTPGPSVFEAAEIALRIIRQMDGTANRSEVATMVERLRAGQNASLGGILAKPKMGWWEFEREPPRKS